MTEKFLRKQLAILKPLLDNNSLETTRKQQNLLGELMAFQHRLDVTYTSRQLDNFEVEWIVPKDDSSQGVILYLHGGGYTCGSQDYARGFGSTLASKFAMKVLCCAYRLAPENKFPCAVDDALEAYRYLIANGFTPDKIILCGESAGGGLCYSLCIKLAQEGLEMPAGIIAISPWTDLTLSSDSYTKNCDADPSMTKKRLSLFAESYTDDIKNPLASPLFFKDVKFPPSIIFVGENEIMFDDSEKMYQKLVKNGSNCKLVVAKNMWHVYLLYGLKEHQTHFAQIGSFIHSLIPDSSLRWVKLDNAAKIFPASKRKGWYNVFRISATLNEHIDKEILQSALNVTVKRFPTVAARLRTGVFWYYLEEIADAPEVLPDGYQPLMRRPFDDVRKCAIRVLYYKNRIAVEFFHAVTDGTGGLVFLKSLLAEYLEQKHQISISNTKGVLDRLSYPDPEELVDSFLENTGTVATDRKEEKAYKLKGEPEPDGFLNLTLGTLELPEVLKLAKEYGATLTEFLTAVMLESVIAMQSRDVKNPKKRKPVKVQIPVNLRKLFGGKTMRNFVMVVNVGVDPRMGEYTFPELLNIVKHQMALLVTKKNMQAIFTTNVNSEKVLLIKVIPLFIKNIVMKAVFDNIGESQACLNISNLGAVDLPTEMKPFVNDFDFIIGPQAATPYNCSVASYNNRLRINIIRRSQKPELEQEFFTRLVKLGLKVNIQSNQRGGNE